MERFELVEGSAAKFWQVTVRDAELMVEYGRIGTKGQSTVKPFDSASAARAAADKLIAEKTRKGYVAVASAPGASAEELPPVASVPAAPAGASPPPGAPTVSDLPDWLPQAKLDDLVAKLKKKSKRGPVEIIGAAVGDGEVGAWPLRCSRVNAAIGILVDRGLLSPQHVGEVIPSLAAGAAWLQPEALRASLAAPQWDLRWAPALLFALGLRAPPLLGDDGAFPERLRVWLPLARRQLGNAGVEIPPASLRALADDFVAGAGSATLRRVENGVPVARHANRYADYRALVRETFGTADWDTHVGEAIKALPSFRDAWRVEPFYESAGLDVLPALLAGAGKTDGALVLAWLEARQDPPDALVEVALAMSALPNASAPDPARHREAVALVAGARLAAAGRPIPESLCDLLFFIDNDEPTRPNHAYARLLAAWPRERVLARVRAILAGPVDERTHCCAVALGVHRDDALTQELLDRVPWTSLPRAGAMVGRLGLAWLPELERRYAARPTGERGGKWHFALLATLVVAGEREGQELASALDVHLAPERCEDIVLWARALALLPAARRDALLVAHARLDPFESLAPLHLASDAALDEVIGLMFAARDKKSVHVTYPKGVHFGAVTEPLLACGPRAWPIIARQFERSGGDARARELFDNMPLPPAMRATLDAGSSPTPDVAAAEPALAQQLGARLRAMTESGPVGRLRQSGSRLAAAEGAPLTGRELEHALGDAAVFAGYSPLPLEGATAGLTGLALRVGDAEIASWTPSAISLDGNLVELLLGDAEVLAERDEDTNAALQELVEECTADGEAVAVYDDRIVLAYVGEVMTKHRLFWGLDAVGAAVCLLATFE